MHLQIKLFIEHCFWLATSKFIQINKWKVVWGFFFLMSASCRGHVLYLIIYYFIYLNILLFKFILFLIILPALLEQ